MPIFTNETLQKKTVADLKEICIKYNIRKGKIE